MITRPPAAVVTILLACSLLFAACDGDDGGDDTPGPTSVATTSATGEAPTAAATPSGEIRELDLEADDDVAALVTSSGGSYVQDNVIYADLTDDGIDEAVVPLASEGTLGNVAFIVLSPRGDEAVTLLQERPDEEGGLQVTVDDNGILTATEAVRGPDDPECCPSMLRVTTYGWNGDALFIERVETIPNPDGGVKTPAN